MLRRSILLILAVAVSSAVTATPLAAQRRADLAVARWSRVRVMVSERPPGKVVGEFVGADSIAVHVVDPSTGMAVAIDWSTVRSIDVRVGRRSARDAFGRGAQAGAIIFGTIAVLGIGYAIAWDLNDGCEGRDYCIPATLVAIPFGYLLTVGGTVVGGVAGLANRDRWRTLWPPHR
jgi:hypothetical protein